LQRSGLGADFVGEVERVLKMIRDQPTLFPLAEADVRVTPIRRFPYAVYYRVKPTRIVILAVFHTSRDPTVWKPRI
jgi:toxin ParE1/3/4